MTSSVEEAIRFFTKWRDERIRLDVIFSGNGVNVKLTGFMLTASLEDGLVVVTDESITACLRASLLDARAFKFTDPREAREEIRPLVEAGIECAWEITLRGGDPLGLYELRSND